MSQTQSPINLGTRDNPFAWQSVQVYAVTIFFYAVVYMVLMILPFYSLTFGATQTEIGVIMGVTMFGSMLARPIAGSIIDRHGASRVFVIALLVFMLSLTGYFVPNLWMFGAVRLIQGLVAAFFSTSMEIITIDLLSARVRGQGLSMYSLATMVPSTFGPAAALWLKGTVSMTAIFLLFSVMGALNFIFSLVLTRRSGTLRAAGAATLGRRKREPGLWKNRTLLVSAGSMLLASVANGAIFTFLPLYLESKGSTYDALYFLVQTLVLVGCRFVFGKRVPSDGRAPRREVVWTTLLAAVGTVILSAFTSLPALLVAAVCNGSAFAMLYPTLLTYVSFHVPDSGRGFLLGLFIGAADLGFSFGALLMGPLAELTSYQWMYGCCVVCLVVACLLGAALKSIGNSR
ncbi:staphylopine family metallophore export MFS transporter CntE [Tumebacillus flagellatus]|uniref:Major facilitator transporter n=1 Tax=Tumebacillus flagellatus TaxID=1157490 RepID=A0A074LP26_9BACL|nr:MFS transporter [Tumebacillus flagellatus]KEO82859.1 major facilitator transporter [Tumebacillus flagellatus]